MGKKGTTGLSSFETEFQELRAALTDESLTPEGICLRMLSEAQGWNPPPERQAEFRYLLRQLAAMIREQRGRTAVQTVLVRECGARVRNLKTLASPPPQLSVRERIAQVFPTLQQRFNWASATIQLLEREIPLAEWPLRSMGPEEIVTGSGRKVNRLDLIDRRRPLTWTNVESWRREHTRLPALAGGLNQP
jgi:hypothetical protein